MLSGVLVVTVFAYLLTDKLRNPQHAATTPPVMSSEVTSPPAATYPPPHSIAVLPSADMKRARPK